MHLGLFHLRSWGGGGVEKKYVGGGPRKNKICGGVSQRKYAGGSPGNLYGRSTKKKNVRGGGGGGFGWAKKKKYVWGVREIFHSAPLRISYGIALTYAFHGKTNESCWTVFRCNGRTQLSVITFSSIQVMVNRSACHGIYLKCHAGTNILLFFKLH